MYRIVLIWVGVFLAGCNYKKVPKIVVIDGNKNISIGKGQKTNVLFEVKNIGNDTLKILSSSTDCQCTVINKTQKFVLPDSSAHIKVDYDSNSSEINTTEIRRVMLRTNAEPMLTVLTIRASIK